MNANSSASLIQQWFVMNDERGAHLVARWVSDTKYGIAKLHFHS
jgi:hypothetical protein